MLEDEWDFNLEWRPNWAPLKNLWLRARYGQARIDQNNVRTTIDEVRLILNYTVKIYLSFPSAARRPAHMHVVLERLDARNLSRGIYIGLPHGVVWRHAPEMDDAVQDDDVEPLRDCPAPDRSWKPLSRAAVADPGTTAAAGCGE